MNPGELKRIIEVALLTAEQPLPVDELVDLLGMDASLGGQSPDGDARRNLRADVRTALDALREDCRERGIELVEVASGYRFQVKASFAHWVSRLQADRPARYSRALLETLALIAYRQPVTRGEIEDIRGVGVSSSIMKTLHEREWIRVLGHREVPGRPAMYGTTRKFLDDFSLKRLEELPPLAEIRELENLHADLFAGATPPDAASSPEGEEGGADATPAAEASSEAVAADAGPGAAPGEHGADPADAAEGDSDQGAESNWAPSASDAEPDVATGADAGIAAGPGAQSAPEPDAANVDAADHLALAPMAVSTATHDSAQAVTFEVGPESETAAQTASETESAAEPESEPEQELDRSSDPNTHSDLAPAPVDEARDGPAAHDASASEPAQPRPDYGADFGSRAPEPDATPALSPDDDPEREIAPAHLEPPSDLTSDEVTRGKAENDGER